MPTRLRCIGAPRALDPTSILCRFCCDGVDAAREQ